MDDSAGKGIDGKGFGDGENAENKAAKSGAGEGAAPENKLPVVWSPKLNAADDIEDDDFGFGATEIPQGEKASETAGASGASSSRSGRFALLAASVSIAAAVGSFAATLAITGFDHATPASGPVVAQNNGAPETKSSKELAELSAIKSALDNAGRSVNAQFAAISQRLEKVEHTQVDPSQLAHISDTVDRLTRLNAAPETTGSIASPSLPPAAAPSAPAEPKVTDRVLEDWVVEDVHGNRALVASRYGGEFLVMPGSMLPGPGHVDAVKRQDGQWVVITAKGVITEGAALPR
jgi:hypothetical protein